MNELMDQSLAQIVRENHRAATVFEKYQLDFCCKGKRSLQQACDESRLQADDVANALKDVLYTDSCRIALDYSRLSLTGLAEYIVTTHHELVKSEIPRIITFLERVAFKHGEHHPEMLRILQLFAEVKEEMEQHMRKEELILFPRIKELEKQSLAGHENKQDTIYLEAPVNVMEQEHEHAGNAMAEIRRLTDNYNPPPDACTTYRLSYAALQAFEIDLHQHVHLENNMLFPKALALARSPKVRKTSLRNEMTLQISEKNLSVLRSF